MLGLLTSLKRQVQRLSRHMYHRLLQWTKPTNHPLLVGTFNDLTRTRSELLAENALLRQQLSILSRQVKRPVCTKTDRALLVLLARAVRNWKQALVIVQPDTLLGWHRQAFRWFWRRRSKSASRHPKIPAETVALIETMALNNRLWGAEHIRGELRETRAFASPNAPYKSTCEALAHVLLLRPGAPSWITMRARSGHATSCPSLTPSSVRSLPSSSSNSRAGK